ncbi:hypothetical protein COY23_03880 [bacterium (Candidatus Torokbacteria) CG_4_10_14_0_2_um_filter_35_8]|nr:MAG: hypothetical protein COY23_03880 [bacterium (Candidatus Torokbacteria) CG_4_10_14_0_2_um_filter_35_8]
MKLLLTSAGWEENLKIREEFLKLTNKEPSKIVVLLITTATKKDKDWKHVKIRIKELGSIGINEKNIKIFSLNKKLKPSNLKCVDIIYVCGGNAFHYLDRMRKTGVDKEIKKLVKKGRGYFGVSAGSIVAGPRINIASVGMVISGDKNDIKLKNLTGLRLTNIIIYPHYSKEEETIKEFEKENRCKVLRLTDKQALLIRGKIKRIIK